MKKKLRYALIGAIPIILCIVAVAIRVTVPKSSTVTIEGDVEVDVRPYYAQATGEVKSLPVGVGQSVSKGDVLAVLDDSDAQYEISQLKITLTKAQAALRDLHASDNEQLKAAQVNIAKNNIAIAEQNLAAASDVLARLREDYDSLKTLYDAGLASKAELDAQGDAVTAQEKAAAIAAEQLRNAEEQLVIAGTDTTVDLTEKINMAEADIAGLEAQIAHAESQLSHYTVLALDDGVVLSLGCDQGGLALSGTQICEVSKENQKKFVFYLPEEYIDYVTYGKTITVTGKTSSKDEAAKVYTATVQYIDLKAEYTPKEAESSANKNRLSFKVEALLEPGCDLRVAQKATVTFGS
ncbi:hypothetical protein SDC9_107485 [bioreactor metagenome]|uniref:Uncharacterized protein n=1 Tax=bioreactor metagenome TaxID=1076179 RepID=A0A645BBS4_9ZZZZ